MNFTSRKASLFIWAVTALACSRALFAFFNDPEGPNLLIVLVTAIIIYALSYAVVYLVAASLSNLKRLVLGIFVQMLLVTILYFFLR